MGQLSFSGRHSTQVLAGTKQRGVAPEQSLSARHSPHAAGCALQSGASVGGGAKSSTPRSCAWLLLPQAGKRTTKTKARRRLWRMAAPEQFAGSVIRTPARRKLASAKAAHPRRERALALQAAEDAFDFLDVAQVGRAQFEEALVLAARAPAVGAAHEVPDQ